MAMFSSSIHTFSILRKYAFRKTNSVRSDENIILQVKKNPRFPKWTMALSVNGYVNVAKVSGPVLYGQIIPQ